MIQRLLHRTISDMTIGSVLSGGAMSRPTVNTRSKYRSRNGSSRATEYTPLAAGTVERSASSAWMLMSAPPDVLGWHQLCAAPR